jgi:hypothetical protein
VIAAPTKLEPEVSTATPYRPVAVVSVEISEIELELVVKER